MGKNVQHIQHVKSNVVSGGKPKLPQPSNLVEGELAINYADGVETISLKNSNNDIVTFSSDEYYTEQKLGSGFTGVNSAVTVTDVIVENEEIISSALTDLDNRKLDASAYTPSIELWEAGSGYNAVVLNNNSGIASGSYAVAEGYKSSATSSNSHAEGYGTLASGYQSHAEGDSTSATSYQAHAEGSSTLASGSQSHAEGYETSATSHSSHAEGYGTLASGSQSHAEGYSTIASGNYSHAEGTRTLAGSNCSHAEGIDTIANNDSEHASGQYNVSSSASTTFGNSGNTLFSVGNGTANNTRHNAFEIRQNGDIYIVNKDGNDVRLQDEIGNIAVDQVLDNTTSASTNPVSSKAVYDAVTDNELVWTNAYVALSGEVSAHTENTEIHVTASDKEKLHTHSNKTYLDAITGNVGTMAYQDASSYSSATQVNTALGDKADKVSAFTDAEYNSTDKKIYFKNSNGTVVDNIDTTDFIKDGMVNNVEVKTVAGSGTCLVISFNTDAGKEDINIPISDIFNASNYYQKSETSGATELSSEFALYYKKTETSGSTELTNAFNEKVNVADVISAITSANSASTNPVSVKVVAENELIVSNALIDLDERKLDASAYTPTDLSNYYTKDETSGATEISNALGAKVNSATYTAYTAATATEIGSKASQSDLTAVSGVVSSHTTAINDLSGQSETIAAALVDLNTNKLDATAYTPTDLSNYYTKSETSGATEISTALSAKASKTEDLDGVKLKKITQSAYDALVQAGTVDPNTLYIITD